MDDPFGIQESIAKIDEIIQREYPIELAKLAEDIFASGGQTHGRNWAPNKPNTIKKKGGNSPNIEGGQLEHWLSTPGNLMDDNFMNELPIPPRQSIDGYKEANKLRRFSDIGQTEDDEQFLVDKMAEKIAEGLSK